MSSASPRRQARPASGSLRARRRLVRDLEERGLIRSGTVRDAFLTVPRETFVSDFAAREGVPAVYRDEAIPTRFGANGVPISSSSQPAIMAEMLEQLALEPGMRVLEIGAGTGYNAALLSEIVGARGRVTTLDVDPEIARSARATLRKGGYRARVFTADGRAGFPDDAPYDRIIVTASSDTVPFAWFEQLTEDGLAEMPLRITRTGAQVIPTLRKVRRRLVSIAVVAGGFMPLRTLDPAVQPMPPPSLTATDTSRANPSPPLRQLSGDALATLPAAAKWRLLALTLTDGRRYPLGLRAEPDALMMYLALTLPARRAITLFPGWTIGTISRDGRSLAYVESRAHLGKPSISSLTAHGRHAARAELLGAIRTWDVRGRPGPRNLQITVGYRNGRPILRHRWRSSTAP